MNVRKQFSLTWQRVDQFLLHAPVVEALIARRESGRPDPDDEETALDLARELLNHQSANGSWGGQVRHTGESLLLLGELLPEVRSHEGAELSTRWLAVELTGPQALSTERIAATAVGLRAALRWSELSPELDQQLSALARLATDFFRPGRAPVLPPAAAAEVLLALAAAPRTPETMAAVHGAASRLVSAQRADGSFADLSVFKALDVLLSVIKAGYTSPAFDAAIERAAEILAFTQQANGSWGIDTSPSHTLVAWRALRHLTHPSRLAE